MNAAQRVVNPWTWQDAFGFVQANVVPATDRLVICAGQTSVDADGRLMHAGDLRAQTEQSFDNLETVLRAAGAGLGDVVRLNYYTTDVDGLMAIWQDTIGARLDRAGCRPASTLLGVTRLAFPELLIEIEATALAA